MVVAHVLSIAESAALVEAVSRARSALPGYDANPPVGCAVLTSSGQLVAVAGHGGAGTPHAEVVALSQAGDAARGGTAIVTLQPCNHHGHTGPCVDALIASGVSRVVYAVADPSGHATNSDERLRDAGIDVVADVDISMGHDLLGTWGFAQRLRRPHVTWKVAASLDGRITDEQGASKWITGEPARAMVHELRAHVGAVVTGTGTVIADNPSLNARTSDGSVHPQQPLRVVVGEREIPANSAIMNVTGDYLHLRNRDISTVMQELVTRGIHRALLECGPTLAAAALNAAVVDEVMWFSAGMLLGQGRPAAAVSSPLAQASRWHLLSVQPVGNDVVMHWRVPPADLEGD
ncbi:MAG: bifunctional diaminohydroxyphosphoribosylaminopyrimidine deaminase/5-amino-6-(5-phosphoribosylamino)uracil reductase RibD [Actinobacteria bacterium]|nr:bifunctional diaminohydroxyphosphoribosylaminopyrimidine deaminase/5-amino-6-(5-phosphoribosylamino)uracil reductase RibD [Actinomycetota bacterium]